MNHDDREALGFLVLGVIAVMLGAIVLLSCKPIPAKAPAAVTHQPRSALI